MDTTEKSREVALLFCKCLNERNFEVLKGLFAKDASWYVLGNPKYVPYGGVMKAEDRVSPASQMLNQFEQFSFTVNGVTAEGNRVAIEGESKGRGPGNKKYNNVYMMQFVMEDGKIKSFREFMDNYEVVECMKPENQ